MRYTVLERSACPREDVGGRVDFTELGRVSWNVTVPVVVGSKLAASVLIRTNRLINLVLRKHLVLQEVGGPIVNEMSGLAQESQTSS